MKIKKVKLTKENKIHIAYEQRSKDPRFYDEFSFTCSEMARPEFYAALKELAMHVVYMCELPLVFVSKIKVRGVSFSYAGENDTMGATISAAMKLENSYPELNLNTPHKAEEMYNADTPPDDMQLLSDACINALKELQEECVLYVKGDRAQGNLFSIVV